VRQNTLGTLFFEAKERLKNSQHQQAGLAARLLVSWASGAFLKDIFITPEKTVDKTVAERLEMGVKRCEMGESVHRIIGMREFYGLNFFLSPSVLEPRPDTEILVDLVLPFLKRLEEGRHDIKILDMGTGSGVLAVSLLSQLKQLYGVGVDIDKDALDIAWKNACHIGVEARFSTCESNWFENVEGQYDLIISNPPYIKAADIANLDKIVRDFDPVIALDGGEDGLDFYRRLASESAAFLKEEGMIGVEIGDHQEGEVKNLFKENCYDLIERKHDLSGIVRALLFKRNESHFS